MFGIYEELCYTRSQRQRSCEEKSALINTMITVPLWFPYRWCGCVHKLWIRLHLCMCVHVWTSHRAFVKQGNPQVCKQQNNIPSV